MLMAPFEFAAAESRLKVQSDFFFPAIAMATHPTLKDFVGPDTWNRFDFPNEIWRRRRESGHSYALASIALRP
jgi:hypothetical protein